MSLADQFDDHLAIVLNTDHVAQEITYTPPDGDPETVTAVVVEDDADGEEQHDRQGQRVERSAFVELAASVSIDLDGTFTVGGDEWKILGVAGEDAAMTTYRVRRISRSKVRTLRSHL